jgi:hypothetical protein
MQNPILFGNEVTSITAILPLKSLPHDGSENAVILFSDTTNLRTGKLIFYDFLNFFQCCRHICILLCLTELHRPDSRREPDVAN